MEPKVYSVKDLNELAGIGDPAEYEEVKNEDDGQVY